MTSSAVIGSIRLIETVAQVAAAVQSAGEVFAGIVQPLIEFGDNTRMLGLGDGDIFGCEGESANVAPHRGMATVPTRHQNAS
ncbi:MAG: hypothetical protein ACO37F_01605 [Pirellulales bacterium]|jgi:hypothetical protein